MQQIAPSDRFFGFQFVIDECESGFSQFYDVTAEGFQLHVVPTGFGAERYFFLFGSCQPAFRNNLSVGIGCITQYVANLFAYIVAWNPAVTFGADALSDTVYKNGVMGAGGAMTIHAVDVDKADVESATVK